MSIKYKIDILKELSDKGYAMKDLIGVFGQSAFTKFRRGVIVTPALLERVCLLLGKQPGDLIEYERTEKDVKDITERLSSAGVIFRDPSAFK